MVDHRDSTVKRGLSFVFTLMTWVTIAPPVLIGLAATAVFMALYLKTTLTQLAAVAAVRRRHHAGSRRPRHAGCGAASSRSASSTRCATSAPS